MLSQIHLSVLVLGDAEMFLFAVDICLEELVPVGMKDREGCPINCLRIFSSFALLCLTLLVHIHSQGFNHCLRLFSPALLLPCLFGVHGYVL